VVRVTALKTAGKCMMKLAVMTGRCPGGNISGRTQRLFENTLKSKVQKILIAIFETYKQHICFSFFPRVCPLFGFSCGENPFLNSCYNHLSAAALLILCKPDPQAILMI